MKVKFHNPDFPNDIEFDVGGLVIINGKTVEFNKDQLDRYQAQHGVALKERLLNNEFATVDGKQGKVTYLHPAEDETDTNPPEPEKEGDK